MNINNSGDWTKYRSISSKSTLEVEIRKTKGVNIYYEVRCSKSGGLYNINGVSLGYYAASGYPSLGNAWLIKDLESYFRPLILRKLKFKDVLKRKGV